MSQSGTYSSAGTPPPGSILTLTGNSGGAVGPTAGNINVVGTGVVDVVGTPGSSTLTISLTSSGGTNEFDTDSGSAFPSSGVIDIAGGSNIHTLGATNVVTVGLNNTVSISGSFTAGTSSGFITAQTGDVSIVAGNLNLPTTLSSADEGVINIDGSPFIQNLAGNIIVGKGAGNFTLNASDAINNVIIGEGAFPDITTGANNVVIGEDSLLTATSASQNVVIGASTGGGITSGSGNIIVGPGSGANFLSTESNNIVIGSAGSSALNNTIIIGTQGSGSQQQDACFIAGINGVTVSNQELVTINSVTGQLGVTSVSGTTWQTVTGATNLVTQNGYFVNGSSQVVLTLPVTANVGDTFYITTIPSAVGGWLIAQNAGQNMVIGQGALASTVGVTGSVSTATNFGQIMFVCNIANTQFVVYPFGSSIAFT